MDYPPAIVFDLDYTFWPCWCDTHISMPLKSARQGRLIDSSDYVVDLYPEVVPILQELRANNVMIFTASRTATPRIAKRMLTLFGLDDYIDDSEWGYHSKIDHIERLVAKHNRTRQKGTDGHLRTDQICLFDDEWRNHDVEKIGVTFCHLKDEELTMEEFRKGIEKWRTRHGDVTN